MAVSVGCLPWVTSTVWEPGMFLVWNQMSLLLAVFKVSLSFWRLLRPTSTVNPSEVVNSMGALTPAGLSFLLRSFRR